MAQTSVDRRQHPRVQVTLAASVTRLGGRDLRAPVSVLDLSEGGARIAGPAELAVGDVLVLTIEAAGLGIEHQGLVVGRLADDEHALLNLAFKTVDEAGRAELRRLIDQATPARSS